MPRCEQDKIAFIKRASHVVILIATEPMITNSSGGDGHCKITKDKNASISKFRSCSQRFRAPSHL